MGLIKGVDQGDEAFGFVEVIAAQRGDIFEHENLEGLGYGEVVARAEHLATEVVKRCAAYAVAEARDFDLTAFDRKDQWFRRASGEVFPDGVDLVAGLGAGLHEIDLGAGEAVLSVVGWANQFPDPHLFLNKADKRQEKLTVEAVFVEVVGHPVGGGHNHGASGKKLFEETADDHGVGDVGDLHFVKGQHTDGFGHRLGHRGDGIFDALLAGFVHGLVDFLHKGVKMHAAHRHVEAVDKQVHQHRFAAPNTAPEIEPLHRVGGGFAEPAFLHRFGKFFADALKLRQDRFLGIVVVQIAGGDAGGVNLGQGRHKDPSSPRKPQGKGTSSHG